MWMLAAKVAAATVALSGCLNAQRPAAIVPQIGEVTAAIANTLMVALLLMVKAWEVSGAVMPKHNVMTKTDRNFLINEFMNMDLSIPNAFNP